MKLHDIIGIIGFVTIFLSVVLIILSAIDTITMEKIGEMIYKMRVEWLIIFGVLLTLTSIYNFIMEFNSALHSKQNKEEKE